MNQVEDRPSVLDDKVEELDQTSKEYEKEGKSTNSNIQEVWNTTKGQNL